MALMVAPFGMEWGPVAAFTLAATLIELTPGPNMTWLAIVAVSRGRRQGYAAVAGVCLGLAIIGVAASLGLATLIAARPTLYQAVRWAGVLYLLWLAVDAWRQADGTDDAPTTGDGLSRFFRQGLTTNLLNPKAAVFYVAVLPGFVTGTAQTLAQTLSLTAIYVAIATIIHAGVVTLAGAARPLLEDARRSRIVRRALAVALACVSFWLAYATRL